jgi:hypothetical protein
LFFLKIISFFAWSQVNELVKRIQDDGVHVLFDMNGLANQGNRKHGTLESQAAPIQIGFLAYPGRFHAFCFCQSLLAYFSLLLLYQTLTVYSFIPRSFRNDWRPSPSVHNH